MLVINDVKTMIKICNGKIDCKKILDALPFDTRNLNLRENLPFYLDFNNRRYLDNDPINRLCKWSNDLILKNRDITFNEFLNFSDYTTDVIVKKTNAQYE